MFSSTTVTHVLATLCFSTLSATAPVLARTLDFLPYGRPDMVLTHFERHGIPCAPTSSTDATSASVHKPLIGGCNGTKFGCCGFPIGGVPRSTAQDSCASQNCTACVEAVAYIEGSSPVMLNATSHIIMYISDICEDIAGPQAKQCVQITRTAVSAIKYVEAGMNASNVCSHLGFCNSTTATTVLRST